MKKQTHCEKCEKPFDYEAFLLEGREIFPPTVCTPCQEAEERDRKAKEKEAAVQSRIEAWEALCPLNYHGTDPFRLPDSYRLAIQSWHYGPKGVGFVGDPGLGKTRAGFEILRRHHFAGRQVFAISSKRLSDRALEKFDDTRHIKSRARDDLAKAQHCEILLLDDLGKGKFTERAEEELYDLLESRTSYRRPTIWTANSTGDELLAKLSADRGAAILRRLVEFSEIL